MAAFDDMKGGEIYIKIPSMNIIDIAKAVSKEAKHEIVGIRPGEKLHEQMMVLKMRLIHMNIQVITKFFQLFMRRTS